MDNLSGKTVERKRMTLWSIIKKIYFSVLLTAMMAVILLMMCPYMLIGIAIVLDLWEWHHPIEVVHHVLKNKGLLSYMFGYWSQGIFNGAIIFFLYVSISLCGALMEYVWSITSKKSSDEKA